MTYLGYSFSNGRIYVAQDSLATAKAKDGPRPWFCVEKSWYFEHLNCVIAGTGDMRMQYNAWQLAWRSSSVEQLIDGLPARILDYRKSSGEEAGSDNLVEGTIFVFYFDDSEPKLTRFTLARGALGPVGEDCSANLVDGKVAIKPSAEPIQPEEEPDRFWETHATLRELQEELSQDANVEDELAFWALATHLSDCALPRIQQVGIGGQVKLLAFSPLGLTRRGDIIEFPTNANHGIDLPLLSPDEAVAESDKMLLE